MKKKKVLFSILLFILLISTTIYVLHKTNIEKKIIQNDYVFMTYEYNGLIPNYNVKVNITNNIATVFLRYPDYEGYTSKRELDCEFVEILVDEHYKIDFFNLTINDYFVYDVGKTEITYKDNNINKTIKFIYINNQSINQLITLYRKIISQEKYIMILNELKDDKSHDYTPLNNLETDIRDDNLLDVNEFIPIFKYILENINYSDNIKRWVLSCLSAISGEEFNSDINLALDWINKNY